MLMHMLYAIKKTKLVRYPGRQDSCSFNALSKNAYQLSGPIVVKKLQLHFTNVFHKLECLSLAGLSV